MKFFDWVFGRSKSEVDRQRSRLKALLEPLAAQELANQAAAVASRIEYLQSRGEPIYTPPARQQESKPPTARYRPVPVYERDEVTGYPFKSAVHWEQDPLFGWNVNGLDDFYSLGTGWPVSAFPRELYPERPTTLRTQIAQDAIRFQSRVWYETVPQYSGPIGHLRNYICGCGMTVDATAKNNDEKLGDANYEQGEAQPLDEKAELGAPQAEAPSADEILAERIQTWIDKFCGQRADQKTGQRISFGLHRRIRDSVLNFFRDGEDAIRIIFGKDGMPALRSVDTSTIRGPHNEITGPWAYGVLTDWPYDFEDVKAYHLWYSNNEHENVSPKYLHLAKLDTTGPNVKRGVPLAYKIRKQLPQMSNLLDCMAVGEASRQSIPYIVQYSMADKGAVRAATPSSLDQYDSINSQWNSGAYADETKAGSVRHIPQKMEFQPPPTSTNNQGGTQTYRTLCEAIAAAINVPLWMVTSTADSETEASALVAESPVVLLIQNYQQQISEHYQSVIEDAIDLCGEFPEDWRERVCVLCELPPPVSRDPDKAVTSDLALMHENLLSPQDCCRRQQLDFDEQQDKIRRAEEQGWQKSENIALDSKSGNMDNSGNGGTNGDRNKSPV